MTTAIAPAIVTQIHGFFHEENRPEVTRDETGRIGFWNFSRTHFIVEFSNDTEARRCLLNPSEFYGDGNEDAMGLGN